MGGKDYDINNRFGREAKSMQVNAQRITTDAQYMEVRAQTKPAEVKPDRPTPEQDKQAKREPVDAGKLKAAVDLTNEAIRITNYHLEFRLHESSGRYQVKVIDTESQQVIREIPAEKMLEFSASVKQMLDKALGILVDETA
jgi:flagellar protein FlaG